MAPADIHILATGKSWCHPELDSVSGRDAESSSALRVLIKSELLLSSGRSQKKRDDFCKLALTTGKSCGIKAMLVIIHLWTSPHVKHLMARWSGLVDFNRCAGWASALGAFGYGGVIYSSVSGFRLGGYSGNVMWIQYPQWVDQALASTVQAGTYVLTGRYWHPHWQYCHVARLVASGSW